MKLNKTSQPWVMKPGTSPASESGSFSKLFSTIYSWHRIRWNRTHMFHFMKTQYNVYLQQHENKLEISKFTFILVWIKNISLLFMHMCVCTCHTYTRVGLPPQTPVLETFVKKRSFFKQKYYFPRTVSAQRQEALLKALLNLLSLYLLQKAKKK